MIIDIQSTLIEINFSLISIKMQDIAFQIDLDYLIAEALRYDYILYLSDKREQIILPLDYEAAYMVLDRKIQENVGQELIISLGSRTIKFSIVSHNYDKLSPLAKERLSISF